MKFFCVKIKSRFTLIVFLFVLVLSIISFDFLNSLTPKHTIVTNEDRLAFLKDLGYEAELISEKIIVIPGEFGDVFENYNKLQKTAGYNLNDYRGKQATLYSYKILNFDDTLAGYNANIIVYENTVIGGDISSFSINGKSLPLKEKV